MPLFNRWQEVYSSTDLGDIMRRETILQENDITYKTKVTNTSLRLSMNNLDGRAGVSRSNPQSETYRISVEEINLETARRHLHGIK